MYGVCYINTFVKNWKMQDIIEKLTKVWKAQNEDLRVSLRTTDKPFLVGNLENLYAVFHVANFCSCCNQI